MYDNDDNDPPGNEPLIRKLFGSASGATTSIKYWPAFGPVPKIVKKKAAVKKKTVKKAAAKKKVAKRAVKKSAKRK